MAQPVPELREAFLEPLRRTLRWMLGLRDTDGRILCPVHRIEHTGKSACAIVTARILAALDPHSDPRALMEAARGQARRLVARLEREGTSPCHTFRPGRHDPFNCSNHVIDGGAASDALADLVLEAGEALEPAERESFAAASLLHARTYLRYAVLDKGIPAQRAWGLTGLAGAWALERDDELAQAALEAVGVLEAIQHEDGSYPYHPLEWGAEHSGASDVSSFYQSRVTAFLIHALERLGRDPRESLFRPPLQRGLDFLVALQGPDGVKTGLVEAKPWYWGAEHEVASNPFDVAALAAGWRLFGRAEHGRAALRAFDAWAARLAPDGAPRDHLPGPGRERSYQCPLFWSAHAMWIARALPDLERIARALPNEPEPSAGAARRGLDLAVTWFPQAQLARLEDGGVVAWVRGARPAVNASHGSPHGAGLLRVVRKLERVELLARPRFEAEPEAEWSARAGRPSLARGWRAGARSLRFSLWLARVHLRAGRPGEALAAPWKALRRAVLAPASTRAGSSRELTPEVRVQADGVELASRLAFADGTPVEGSRLERRISLDGEGLVVEERLVEPGAARGARYRVPAAASDVEHDARRVRYRLA